MFCYKLNYEDATRPIDFSNAMAIQLDNTTLPAQTFTSEWDKDASVKVNVRKSLMDYYADIPSITNYSFYANQPMDAEVSRQVLPPLRNALMGKTEQEAANLLLHFVQTAFKYASDEEQFGHEKTFFKEELFYYRASDCEDRAILFSELVKQLMGLDVVLLTYPMHMCTAVKFKEDIVGDYVMVDGTKYIICDPTYKNANIGKCAEEYKTLSPTIYKVRR